MIDEYDSVTLFEDSGGRRHCAEKPKAMDVARTNQS